MTTIIELERNMIKRRTPTRTGRRAAGVFVAGAAMLLAGCEVNNPGPIADESLSLVAVHKALVNGAQRKLTESINTVGYNNAIIVRELIHSGNTGITGTGMPPIMQGGHIPTNEATDHWSNVQAARWIAEDAIERFTVGDAKATVAPATLQEAYLWAGYANRFLGENYCEVVFNGGPAEPSTKALERAEGQFTKAIAGAAGPNQTAAYAGRASVRLLLRNFAGAAADAALVPLDFVKVAEAQGPDTDVVNVIWYANSNQPWRSASAWGTWHESYYNETGDPRTPVRTDPAVPLSQGTLSFFGQVPFVFATKYKSLNDDYRVSSGREMVLIRAEVLLEAGQWQQAMTLINSLRTNLKSDKTGQNLAPWTANSLTEAWTFLKRERNIEMWLEGRRFADIRRWEANNTPGAVDWPNFEALSVLYSQRPRSRCWPIPDRERELNPNLNQ